MAVMSGTDGEWMGRRETNKTGRRTAPPLKVFNAYTCICSLGNDTMVCPLSIVSTL